MPRTRILWILLFSLGVGGLAPAADDDLPRETIAKTAKASTALIDLKNSGRHGTAFCVHPSGLFVTNDQSINGMGEKFSLVLDAGQKTQKVLKAQVVRRDKELGLALLKAEGDEKFVPLELGTDKGLGELTEVIVCGFSFGRPPAPGREGEYPAIGISIGNVTSLQNDKQGTLNRIQIDSNLNPGNAGGPVLNRKGKVVGVVVGNVNGGNVNTAIPVSQVQTFLARPTLVFTTPTIKGADRHGEFEFKASSVSLIPSKEPVEMELVVGVGRGKERRFPMKLEGDTFLAKAVAFPKPEGVRVCRVELRYPDGTAVIGTIEDGHFSVGQQELRFSKLISLKGGEMVEALLTGSQKVTGAPKGLDKVAVKVGKQTLKLDFSEADTVTVAPPEDDTASSCMVIAKQGGKEIGRISAPLYIEGVSRPSFEHLPDGKIVKPAPSGTPVTRMRVISSKGDYIGQGNTYDFGPDDFQVMPNYRGVSVNCGGYRMDIGAPVNQNLAVGEYKDAKRFAFSDNSPGIDFSGNGRGSNQIAGSFVVWEIEVKDGKVVKLAIDFIQRSELKGPPLYGSIRINSSFH